MTSPPAVVDDIVVVGSSIDDGARADMPDGVVRAYDARTGALCWKWDPLATRQGGAANAWSVMAVDPDRHLVFVPTGSASPDYFGGSRPGDDKWANSIVALRASNGAVAWGFQLVHHDLWDYDTAAPPLLARIVRNGRAQQVVVQGNKTGFLFVLDRETGASVFGVEERPVPPSDVAGEVASATQPIPVAPPPIARQRLSADDAWGITAKERDACRVALTNLRNEGIFTPPSTRGFPGTIRTSAA
jgi:quinoprotein glucose dehydrogenase